MTYGTLSPRYLQAEIQVWSALVEGYEAQCVI